MINKPNKHSNNTANPPSPNNQKIENTELDTKIKRKAAKGVVDFSIGARAFVRKDTTWS